MADTPDFDLIKLPAETPDAPASPGPWPLVAIGLAIVSVIVAGYVLTRGRSPSTPAAPSAAAPADVPAPAALGTSPFPTDVPPLDDSDRFVRQWMPRLSSHPTVAAWLATDRLIRTFTTVVSNIAEGSTPAMHLPVLRPPGSFRVMERGAEVHVDPRSYDRYDGLAAAIASVDPAGAAQLYATLKPRIEEANAELGAPAGSFDRTLERALVLLLRTPVTDRPLAVEPSGIGYRFADPRLEALGGAQKHLLRMGPANARQVQASLRRLAQALGVPAERLP